MNQELMIAEAAGEPLARGCYCSACGQQCGASDCYCCRCGAVLRSGALLAAEVPRPADHPLQVSQPHWLRRRWVVVAILLVAGPLGLPALWLSPRFSPATKIITSLLYVGLTVILPIALTWYWLDHSLQPLVEAFGKLPTR